MLLKKLSVKARAAADYLKEKGGTVTDKPDDRLPRTIREGIGELIERRICTWYIEDNGDVRYEFE